MSNPVPRTWTYENDVVGIGQTASITVPRSGAPGVGHVLTEVKFRVYCLGAPTGVYNGFVRAYYNPGAVQLWQWEWLLDEATPGETSDTIPLFLAAKGNCALTVDFTVACPNALTGQALQIQGYSH